MIRIFALSDLHVDYAENLRWVEELSHWDYQDDILLLAGDVSHDPRLLAGTLTNLRRRFQAVLFVPGNHDLWVHNQPDPQTSWDKFLELRHLAEECGASTRPLTVAQTCCIPLFSWYDYSFGEPTEDLRRLWMDFRACRWPGEWKENDIASHFYALNPQPAPASPVRVITCSHFLPRIDLVPSFVPPRHRALDPVLGSSQLEQQLRAHGSVLHVYGHSHINRTVSLNGVTYVNNALGYPQEQMSTAKEMHCIDQL